MPSLRDRSNPSKVPRARRVRRSSGVVRKTAKKVKYRSGARKRPGVLSSARHLPALRPLARHEDNPILEPRSDRFWEMRATFNPGAVYADHRVHLLYRAIGGDDVSVLGYARSDDGVAIIARGEEPAYVPAPVTPVEKEKSRRVSAVAYFSGGGGNGGCEDPRLTLIDDHVYLIYTAFDGWGSIRIALSSISLENFLQQEWKWRKPALISPPGEVHKNWVLFPEKIRGKFAVLHSISPAILIDYFDSLEEFDEGRVITSEYKKMPRSGVWDSWIRGAGPPPIRTKLGWLLFYHAMDIRDPNRYKLGAMILDADDPTKVLYRSRVPILEPDLDYENNGFKAGVIYSCGAVVKDGTLYVYYGGGDTVTCVAMADLGHFLEELKAHGEPRLQERTKTKNK